MSPVQTLNRRRAAHTESQIAAISRARNVGGLAGGQLTVEGAMPEELHGRGYLAEVRVHRGLEEVDSALTPTIDGTGVQPAEGAQNVYRGHILLLGYDGLGRLPDSPFKPPTGIRGHATVPSQVNLKAET